MKRFSSSTFSHLVHIVVILLLWNDMLDDVSGTFDFIRLQNGISKGAVCLDGTVPGFYLERGLGAGENSWVVHLEGGGWCLSEEDCYNRSQTPLGSSKNWGVGPLTILNGGILGSSIDVNPDFYNWNRIYVKYCDGASFFGDIEELSPIHKLYRRGARIFDAVVDNLLEKGMKNAQNAILSGNSAGGLACMLQCEHFQALLPAGTQVKCISDAGFFIHAKNLPGAVELREVPFASVVEYHELGNKLHKSCTAKMNPGLCLFPENFIEYIKLPLFIVNSDFDKIQLNMSAFHIQPGWFACIRGAGPCTPAQLQGMQDYRTAMIEALPNPSCGSKGVFMHSCYLHDEIYYDNLWSILPKIENKTIGNAIGDWFRGRCSYYVDNTSIPVYCIR